MIMNAYQPAALVLGAGVVGLTTALTLRRHGWRVTVAAVDSGRGLVSSVAGALWEWPPSVCGRHHDETRLGRSKPWAMASYRQFQQLAGHPEHTGDLRDQETALLEEFAADVIINCTGLGASELAADTAVSPHRGALLRVRNDGTTMPRITTAHAVAHDVSRGEQDMVFIVLRGEHRLLLGGLVEPDAWATDLTLEKLSTTAGHASPLSGVPPRAGEGRD